MKKLFTILSMVGTIGLSMMMQGCEADVDLNNIDKDIQVEANLTIPVGSFKASIGDFVGNGQFGIYVDSLENHGVLTFKETFGIERHFHQVDLSRYISSTTLNLNVYEKLKAAGLLLPGDKIMGTGTQVPLSFPLTMKLDGINHNLSNQRLDSALIKNASFISTITPKGNLPIKWEWIDKVDIHLGSAFHRPAGNVVTVYKKGDNYKYGQPIPINVDEFSLCLMKNRNLDPTKKDEWKKYLNNVVDSCSFDVTMYVTIPTSAGMIDVPSTSVLSYNLGVQFINYHAIWGMFEPNTDMSAHAEDAIADYWSMWNTIPKLCLPLAKPSVELSITTQMAGALIVESDYLYTKNNQGITKYATFDGKQEFQKYFNKNEYLPLTSQIGDTAKMTIHLDSDSKNGDIDNLFSIRPDKVGYHFAVRFNEQETPQLRITDNTLIRLEAECKVPMIFNEGLVLAYADTLGDLDLSDLDIDAFLDSISILDTLQEAKAKLVVAFESTIPLDIKGKLTCLDAEKNVIIDPKTNKPLQLTDNETIIIAGPKQTFENHQWHATPNQSVQIIEVDRQFLETLKQVKKVAFEAELNDESMRGAYEQGLFNVKLENDSYIRARIGVGATVEAVLSLDSLINI